MADQLTQVREALAQQTGSQHIRLAVTGHQKLGGSATEAFLAGQFGALLAELRGGGLNTTVLTGLAAGADTLFAEVALAHQCAIESVLACLEIEANFAPGHQRERFRTLRDQSRVIHQLPFIERSNGAYMALGRWLVETSDLLVAAWNGLPAAAEGGTGDVVAYAVDRGRPVLHLHTQTHHVNLLIPPWAGLPNIR